MNKIYLPNYNIEKTLLGGQSFAWDYEDGYYYGALIDRAVKLKREGDFLFWQTYPEYDDFDFIKKYFRLDDDYESIIEKISKDKYIKTAIKTYPGLRVLKQNFEQTLMSFILSSNRNIKLIRKSIRLINKDLGEKIKVDDREIYLFPKPEKFEGLSIDYLKIFKLGYRAEYLKSGVDFLLNNKDMEKVGKEKALEKLKQIKGVGDKVADCVLLFGLGFDDACPIDVWAKRALINYYGFDNDFKYSNVRKWLEEYFEGYAGYAGHFLFEYIRGK